MLTVEQALVAIKNTISPIPASRLPLNEVAGLPLAEPIIATLDSPPFDKSLMDGFAVRSCDIDRAGVELDLLERLTAGEVPTVSLTAGKTVQVMTGTQLPAGTDAVVKIEDVSGAESDRIRIEISGIAPSRNMLHQGESLQAGETVLEAGARLKFPQISLLAELGFAQVQIFRRPTVSILATGNELVPVDQSPGPGQIRNSNESMLIAQIENGQATPVPLGIARDEVDELRTKILQGLDSDFLILSGGVSAGVLDLVPKILQKVGVKQVFHKVQLKPGKPIWFGQYCREDGKRSYVFGLPGNPVSALVCFELFVREALRCFQRSEKTANSLHTAYLQQAHLVKSDRPVYYPAQISFSDGKIMAKPVRWVGSADIRGTSQANGMICFPPGEKSYQPGDQVQIQFWHSEP